MRFRLFPLTLMLLTSAGAFGSGYYNRVMFLRPSAAASGSCSTINLVQVRTAGTYEVNAGTQSVSINQTAGNLVVAVATWAASQVTPISISDTRGTIWMATAPRTRFEEHSNPSNTTGVQIFYALNVAGGANTVTVTQSPPFDSSSWTGLALLEYSGVAASAAVDIVAGATANGVSSPDTGLMTLSSTLPNTCKELVVGAFENDGTSSYHYTNAGSGWMQRLLDFEVSAVIEDNVGSLAVPGTALSVTADLTASDNSWTASAVAFIPQGSPALSNPTRLAITSAPQSFGYTHECSGVVTIQAQDAGGNPVNVHAPLPVSLSGSGFSYYSDPACLFPIAQAEIYAGSSTRDFYFSTTNSGTLTLTASATGLSSASQTESVAALDPFSWKGGSSCDGLWSTGACWSGGAPPGASDTAYFDNSCTTHCTVTLNSDVTISHLRTTPNCVDTILIGARTLTLLGSLRFEGGTLNGGTGAISVNEDVHLIGGTWTMPQTLTVAQDYVVSGANLTIPAGTNVVFNDSYGGMRALTPGSFTYANVTFADSSNYWVTRVLPASATMTIGGNLTLNGTATQGTSLLFGTIDLRGNLLLLGNGYTPGNSPYPTVISIDGSGTQTIDATGTSNGFVPGLAIVSGGTVRVKGTPIVAGPYSYVSGIVDFSAGGLKFNDPSGSFNSWRIVPGNIPYGDVTFADSNQAAWVERYFDPGNTMTVNGTLTLGTSSTLGSFLFGGTIEAKGNVRLVDNAYTGLDYPNPTLIRISGSSNQTIDGTSSSNAGLTALEIASTGGTVSLQGLITVLGDYKYTSGSVNIGSSTLMFKQMSGGYPSRNIDPGTITYNNVSFADSSPWGFAQRVFSPGSTMKVSGSLLLAPDGSGSQELLNGTIEVQGNVVLQGNATYVTNPADLPTVVRLTGSNQIVDSTATTISRIPALTIASTGTVFFKGDPTIQGDYIYSSGNIDMSTYGSTLRFDDPACGAIYHTLSPGSLTYGEIDLIDSDYCQGVMRTIPAGMTLNIGGNLVLASQNVIQSVQGGKIAVSGDVVVQGGYQIGTDIQVGGNWNNSANDYLAAVSGTVTFTPGVTHTILGDNAFFSLKMDDSAISAPGTLVLAAGHEQVIQGGLFLAGNASNRLKIKSSLAGTLASLKPSQTVTLGGNLDIQDIKNSGSNALYTGLNSVGPSGCAPLQNDFNITCAQTIAYIQSQSTIGGGFSITTAPMGNPSAEGDLVVVQVAHIGGTTTSVTDSLGNSYIKAVGPTLGTGSASGITQEIWYAFNINGGTGLSVTANFSSSISSSSVNIAEYTGASRTSPLDRTASIATNSINVATSPMTTTAANELILGAATATAASAGAGFTQRSSIGMQFIEDKNVSSAGSYSASTSNTVQDVILQMATFK